MMKDESKVLENSRDHLKMDIDNQCCVCHKPITKGYAIEGKEGKACHSCLRKRTETALNIAAIEQAAKPTGKKTRKRIARKQ